MTSVDERIVAMYLDNKNFERNAKQTLETLDKLREGMNFEGAAKGMNEIGTLTDKISFEKTTTTSNKFKQSLTSIGNVAKKTFSATTFPLRKIGNELRSLGNEIKNWAGIDIARTLEQAGLSFARSLTIDPLRTGWNEYEMKMDSIRTIMSGTAKEFKGFAPEDHLSIVKARLEELNQYADDTIYSFKDMTSNIGKFTNAGVSLEDATRSMMGISNLAAKAGQGTQQATMAMYNFAQSMSMGYVELRDWRSIENANMATLEFKQTLIDTAVAMGTLKKDSKGVVRTINKGKKGKKGTEVTAEGIRETLREKWLTGDVLTAVLELYSGEYKSANDVIAAGLISATDEKGRKKTKEQMVEEAEALLKIGSDAKKAATEVRTFTKMYDALKEAAQSGWAMSWEYIFGDMKEATTLWTNINNHLSGILEKYSKERNRIILAWRGQVKKADGTIERVSDFDGRTVLLESLQMIVNVIEDLIITVRDAWQEIFGVVDEGTLIDLTIRLNEFAFSLREWFGSIKDPGSRINKLKRILMGLFSAINTGYKILKKLAGLLVKIILPVLDPLLDIASIIGNFFTNLGDSFAYLLDTGDFSGFLAFIGETFNQAIIDVKEVISGYWDKFKGWLTRFLFGEDLVVKKPSGAENVVHIKGFFEIIGDEISKVINEIPGKLAAAWKTVTDWFDGIKKWLFGEDLVVEKPSGAENTVRIKGFFERVGNDIAETIKAIPGKLSDAWKTVKEWLFGKEVNVISDTGGDGDPIHILGFFDRLGINIAGAITSMPDTFSTAWKSVTEWFDGIKRDLFGYDVDVISDTGGDGEKLHVRGVFDNVIGSISAEIEKIKKTPIYQSISGFFGTLGADIAKSVGKFTTNVSTAIAPVTGFFDRLIGGITSKIEEIKGSNEYKAIAGFFEGIWNDISKFFTPDEETGKSSFDNALNTVIDTITSFPSKASEAWKSVTGWFTKIKRELFGEDINVISDTGGDGDPIHIMGFFDRLIGGITSKIEEIKGSNEYKAIAGFFEGIWNDISKFFTPDEETGKSSFDNALNTVIDTITSFPSKASEAWKSVSGWFDQIKRDLFGYDVDVVSDTGGDGEKLHIRGALDGIISVIAAEIEKIKNSPLYQSVAGFLSNLWADIFNFFTGTDEETGELNFIAFAKRAYADIVKGIEEFKNSEIFKQISKAVSDLWNIFSDILFGSDEGETAEASSKKHDVIGILASAGTSDIIQAAPQLNSSLTQAEGVYESAIVIANRVQEKSGELSATVKSWNISAMVKRIVESVIGWIKRIAEDIGTAIGDVNSAAREKWDKVVQFFSDINTKILQPLINITTMVLNFVSNNPEWSMVLLGLFEGLLTTKEVAKSISSENIGGVLGKASYQFLAISGGIWLLSTAIEKLGTLATERPGIFYSGINAVVNIAVLAGLFIVALKKGLAWAETSSVASLADRSKKLGAWGELGENILGKIIDWAGIFLIMKEAVPNIIKEMGALKGVEFGSILGVCLGIVVLMGGLLLVVEMASKLGNFSMSSFGKTAEAIGVAILALGITLIGLGMLGNMLSDLGVKEGMTHLGEIFGTFIGAIVGGVQQGKITGTAKGIKDAATIISDVNEMDVQKLARLMQTMNYIADMMPDTKRSVWEWLGGETKFTAFRTNMTDLAMGVRELDAILNGDMYVTTGTMHQKQTFFDRIGQGVDIDRLMSFSEALHILLDTIDIASRNQLGNATNLVNFLDYISQLSFDEVNYTGVANFLGSMSAAMVNDGMKTASLGIDAKVLTDAIKASIQAHQGDVSKAVQDALYGATVLGNNGTNTPEQQNATSTIISGMSQFLSVFSEGQDKLSGLTEYVNSKTTELIGGFTGTSEAIRTKLEEGLNGINFQNFNVETFTNSLLTASFPTAEEVKAQAETMVRQFKEGVSEKSSLMSTVGGALDTGLAAGIEKYRWVPINAMRVTALKVVSTAQEVFDQHSPSKVFEGIGKYNMEGLADGTTMYGDRAITAVRDMGTDYISELQSAFAPLGSWMMEDLDSRPVITPVLDMSEVRSGLSGIGGMFSGYSLSPYMPGFGRSASIPDVRGARVNDSQSITDKLDELNANLMNLQVVLDSGAIVGGIGNQMDRFLGQKASRYRRG